LYRDGVGEVSEVITDAYLNHTWSGGDDALDQIMRQKLNLISASKSATPGPDTHYDYTYVLENGTTLQMHPAALTASFVIDYNGLQPPNQMFQDRLQFAANLRDTANCGLNPGGVGPWDPVICPSFPFSGPLQPVYDYFMEMVVN
jgi:hypothetical protein